ncbi:hypothetical protein [Mesobacillus subterraneus]|uniref:Uncharacterized protein n=1 Tax=Mesobacillus subterraneus TaxID=285983 RepID=A0A427TYQ3_9BACI|nr:hypothetical protein [Mesobacillus subterraneus]RSD29593.1 hypothetical protein EJA10_00340 [Mesobacillus subterraneus]
MELNEILFSDMTNRPKKNEVGFNHQTRIFQLLLRKYLKGIQTEDVRSLSVYCLDKVKEIEIDPYTIENGLTVKVPYNPTEFLKLESVEEKYAEYVRIFEEFIVPVFRERNWDYAPVVKALEKIKEHNYQAEFLLKGTPKKSPDKNHTAIVYGLHTVSLFQLKAKIYDKDGMLIKEGILVEEVPNEIVYARFLGKPAWKDDRTFEVSSKSSQWVGSLTVD